MIALLLGVAVGLSLGLLAIMCVNAPEDPCFPDDERQYPDQPLANDAQIHQIVKGQK